ncbi:MAG: sulfurtransferase TusA family protein [Gammaproteobacteria bacterium]|nr:MAG: sulfurtransferase TusA family protein [Gammaproteobacteria bacterium]
MSAFHELDARGLLCPLPVIRTQNRMKELKAGERLIVKCTDPGALHDIPAWCRVHGHRLIDSRQNDQEIVIEIEKLEETRV